MDYLAVAKVGILVFADHIHDTFIDDNGGWKAQLWYSLMGSNTLVDLVNQIWNVVSTAVSTIKDGTTKALNAVKSGLSFIANAARKLIIEANVFAFKMLLFSIYEIIKSVDPSTNIEKLNNGIRLEQIDIRVYREEFSFVLEINNVKIKMGDLILNFNNNFETLGLENPNVIMTGIGVAHDLAIGGILISEAYGNRGATNTITYGTLALMFTSIFLNVQYVKNSDNYSQTAKDQFKADLIVQLALTALISLFFGLSGKDPSQVTNFASSNFGQGARYMDEIITLITLIFAGMDILNNLNNFEDYILGVLNFLYLYLSISYIDGKMANHQRTENINGQPYKDGAIFGMKFVHKFVKLEAGMFLLLALVIGVFL